MPSDNIDAPVSNKPTLERIIELEKKTDLILELLEAVQKTIAHQRGEQKEVIAEGIAKALNKRVSMGYDKIFV